MLSLYLLGITCVSLFSSLFAAETVAVPPVPKDSTPVHQLFFSPQDHVDERLISLIESEKEEIRAAVYCLTHRGIIKALMDARKRGVHVEIVVDPFTMKAKAPLKRMAQAGLSLYVWDPKPVEGSAEKGKVRFPLMHNKFCIFGRHTVWTGSFNFTSEASHANMENVVVLSDSLAAKRYVEEFERVKNEGCSPFRSYLANRETLKNSKKKK